MDEIAVTELEALLRATLGDLFRAALGDQWQDELSSGARTALAKTRDLARRNRDGVPDDPWQSAGLREIGSAVKGFARDIYEGRRDYSDVDPDGRLGAGLKDLGWNTVTQLVADFERIESARHAEGHPGVVAPLASTQLAEIETMRQRLRLGCEQVRRRLMDDEEEWFPYIERVVVSGVDGWTYVRHSQWPQLVSLAEGDEIEFVVSAVNTSGTNDGLRYGLYVQPDGGSFETIFDDSPESRLVCYVAPPGRNVIFNVRARSVLGGHDASGWDDDVSFTARIRPTG